MIGRTIYKYPLMLVEEQNLVVPVSFRFCHVGLDPSGQVCIWGEVETGRSGTPEKALLIHIRGTGHEIPDLAEYRGSVCQGPFMWHVFTNQNNYVHR